MKTQFKNKNHLFTLLFLLIVWMVNIPHTFAQGLRKEKKHVKNAEIKAYKQENILPVIASQRKKLDSYLSDNEKAQVKQIREEMKALRMEIREQRKSIDRDNGPTAVQKDWLREKRKEQRQLMNQAWEIADRHDDQIAALTEEMKQDVEKWKEDLRSMRKEQRAERTDDDQRRQRKGRKGRGGHKVRGMRRDFAQPVRFLLFDPEKTGEEKNEGQGFLELYPNPSSDILFVGFDQQKPGEVQCALLNDKGHVIKVYEQGLLTSGNHRLEIDISALPSGVYFYELTSTAGTFRKRFLKE